MTGRKSNWFVLASFSFALIAWLAMPLTADAQNRNRYNRRDVNNTIAKLERTSDEFRREFERQMDNNRVDRYEEDRLISIVNNYESSLDELRREFDRSGNNNWWESRADVQNVMRDAEAVNQMMGRLSFARRLERQWNNMRRDLNSLADTFELPRMGGGINNNYNNNNNNNVVGGNVPNWALGTFTARNPQSGGTITLTITQNGNVTVNFDGNVSYATMRGNRLYNGGAEAVVTRIRDGIRTTSVSDGEAIDYYRGNGYGGGNVFGGGGVNNNGVVGGNVPSWAVGTFVARNPETGGTIALTINADGNVTVNFDGNISYATINGSRLFNNGAEARVTRTRNGIRTTSVTDGAYIDYVRQNY